MNPNGHNMAFPASLFGGSFWAIVIYTETSRAITSTYSFLEDFVTGLSNLVSSTTHEVLVLSRVVKPEFEIHSFPQFSKLPTELRCQIWRKTFPESRVVELRDGPGHRGRITAQKYYVPWESPAPNPIALQVCRESREEALRNYELSFSRSGFPPQIYVNFEKDIIYFGHKTRADGVLDMDGYTQGFEKIQNLAIGFSGMSRLVDWQLDELASLKEIIMVRSMTPGRYFKIGRSPRLVKFEQDDGEVGEFKMDVLRAVALYVKRLRERQETEFPYWEIPLVKVGMLTKTNTDGKYY